MKMKKLAIMRMLELVMNTANYQLALPCSLRLLLMQKRMANLYVIFMESQLAKIKIIVGQALRALKNHLEAMR